ncbi:Asp23/Gls24 family envelope stress response protein [Helicovermis profundi]|uniref:ATPase n=1 Tax=Helicovermis profundi TaxID=3065157 RepID=A0AAU9E0N4_9FIRM|nr:ATPase [Clostridia bacterium S502]
MKVYALVGKSGTGKSHRAMKVAFEKDIDYIIDDGLLIEGTKKIAGSSAKRENTKIAAVKRALFFNDNHREEVVKVLKKNFDKTILIIGTSIKMVENITETLELTKIDEFVFIEDISSKEEIEKALSERGDHGKHVIPLPAMEIKSDFSGYFLDTFKTVLRRKDNRIKIGEKSVVRPTYSYIGNFVIFNRTIIQIIEGASFETNGIVKIIKSKIRKVENGIFIESDVVSEYGYNVLEVAERLQNTIKSRVEYMSNINVTAVNIVVRHVKTNVTKN